jgi:hypothetical protein
MIEKSGLKNTLEHVLEIVMALSIMETQ